MKPTIQIALALAALASLAFHSRVAAADTPVSTAIYRPSVAAVQVTPARHYRSYGYYRPSYRPYYAYRPSNGYGAYYGYRPYVYQPYVVPPVYGNPYYSFVPPYVVGYRYPGAYVPRYYRGW